MNLKSYIRQIPNWPKKGITFYDITTLFENPEAFYFVVNKLTERFKNKGIDKVVGIDARGFLLAGVVAYQLKTGVSLVRKKGKLPYKTISQDYTLEYASETIEIHEDTIKKGEKVIIIDDLLATGGTIGAACDLIEKLKGKVAGIGCVIDLPFLGGREKIKKRGYDLYYLIEYANE